MQVYKRSMLLTILLAASFVITGCSNASEEPSPSKQSTDKEVVAVPVEVAEVTVGDINAVYTNTTSLQAEQEAVVVAKTSELISEIFVEEGDVVKKGQVLAQLHTAQQSLELKQAEVNLRRLQAEVARNKLIFEKKMISSDVFEKLKFDYESQKAAFELKKLQLEYATIVAPIDGVISERMIKVGNMVKVNDPLFRVTDFDPLHAIIHVPEQELAKLTDGMPAFVSVDALKENIYQGSILRISPIVDSASGTFKVTLEVNDPKGQLKPGMFGRIGIVYANHSNTLLMDKNALIAEEQVPSVYVVSDNKAIKTEIETGFENNQHIEVLSGLKAGDQVVVAGQNSLKQDSLVDILNANNDGSTRFANLSQN